MSYLQLLIWFYLIRGYYEAIITFTFDRDIMLVRLKIFKIINSMINK